VARRERYLVGLDAGTSVVAAIVGEVMDDDGLDIIGIGTAESHGIRRGVVVNLEAAVDSIKRAIDEAELTAGVEIDSVHLGLAGTHVKGFNSRGVVAVAGKNREITREDVGRAIDAAKAVERTGDPPRAPARLRCRRAGRDRGSGRHDRLPPRGQRAHRDR
jgi:cell division protein FtsA